MVLVEDLGRWPRGRSTKADAIASARVLNVPSTWTIARGAQRRPTRSRRRVQLRAALRAARYAACAQRRPTRSRRRVTSYRFPTWVPSRVAQRRPTRSRRRVPTTASPGVGARLPRSTKADAIASARADQVRARRLLADDFRSTKADAIASARVVSQGTLAVAGLFSAQRRPTRSRRRVLSVHDGWIDIDGCAQRRPTRSRRRVDCGEDNGPERDGRRSTKADAIASARDQSARSHAAFAVSGAQRRPTRSRRRV